MATLSVTLLLTLLFPLGASSTSAQQNPDVVVQDVHRSINASTRRNLGYMSCGTGNPIDDCWRCDLEWDSNRQRLADCSIGFGRNAVGGRNGRYYVVSDPSDNPGEPRPGTLRHAATREEPLWIIFKRDMVIRLTEALHISSYKTIDGRGTSVHIAEGPCINIHFANNIIVHGIHIHDCRKTGDSDGDGISIMASEHVWVDHCSLSRCYDGLIDVTHASTAITISNNYMTHHDKVMLLGHSDDFTQDRRMQVTVAFNHFGEGLVQRMPRCRYGYFHVVNNDYTHWELYAIGGSSNPTINSQGNRFLASNDNKEVTKHFYASEDEWMQWNWRSDGDLMLNGAYFRASGAGAALGTFARASSLSARPASLVGSMTQTAGALSCRRGSGC